MNLAEHIRAIIAHQIAPTRYYGFYPYEVVGFVGTDPRTRSFDLVPLSTEDGVPPLQAVERIPGFTGAAESFAAKTPVSSGTIVLVGFRGGLDTRPYIAFTLTTIPTAIAVHLSATGGGRFTVQSNPPVGAPVAVALAPSVTVFINALKLYADAIAAALIAAVPAAAAAINTAQMAYVASTSGVSIAATRLSSE